MCRIISITISITITVGKKTVTTSHVCCAALFNAKVIDIRKQSV